MIKINTCLSPSVCTVYFNTFKISQNHNSDELKAQNRITKHVKYDSKKPAIIDGVR